MMGRNAQERRKARKAKTARRVVSRGSGAIFIIADHAETVDGWCSELIADTPDGSVGTTVGPFPTVRETFHAAMAAVRALADEHGPAVTVHQLDGSPRGWASLAAREGLADDAGCDCGECRAGFVAL
jgi:hypothetical protein